MVTVPADVPSEERVRDVSEAEKSLISQSFDLHYAESPVRNAGMNMETSSNQAMHEPADCDEHGIPTQSAHDNILNQL